MAGNLVGVEVQDVGQVEHDQHGGVWEGPE